MRGLILFFAGVAAGLLLAPEPGEKTLRKIRDKLSEMGDEVEDRLKEKLDDED